MDIGKVRDIMTSKVITVRPDEGLDFVAGLFEKYDYDGLPVVDENNKLLGIITEYDMVAQSLGMHLPTVVAMLDKISVDKGDRKDMDAHFGKLKDIKAGQIMNKEPLAVNQDSSLQQAARLFAEHHRVNPLCVTDGNGILTGVLSRYDVIRFFNIKYLKQMVDAAAVRESDKKKVASEPQKQIESEVRRIAGEFLLVGKRRPMIWRVVAMAAFIAGLIAATALIIRLVRRGGDDFYPLRNSNSLSTSVGGATRDQWYN